MIDSGRVDVLIIIDDNKIFEVDDDIKNELIALLKKKADNVITDFPKADIREVKHGKWICTNDYETLAYGTLYYSRCSVCGEESLETGDFCPNCGAEMEEI